jgi:hemolysin activation/secretion protein
MRALCFSERALHRALAAPKLGTRARPQGTCAGRRNGNPSRLTLTHPQVAGLRRMCALSSRTVCGAVTKSRSRPVIVPKYKGDRHSKQPHSFMSKRSSSRRPGRALSHAVARLGLLSLALAATAAWSQVPGAFRPNAGTLLNIYTPPAEPPTLPESRLPQPPAQMRAPDAGGPRIAVSRVDFEGASLVPAEDLQAVVARLVGSEVTLAELQGAAAQITALYRQRGYFLARAYVPAQEIRDGVVRLAVLEGTYGQVSASGSPRFDEARVAATLTAQGIASGRPIEQGALERSLVLIEQKSGAPTGALLQPGATLGTSDLQVQAPAGALLGGTLGADNYGSRFTGQARGTASLFLNSPSGIGDRANLWLAYSTGASAAFASYLVPVGNDGLTLGASAATYRYELCCQFADLERSGDATVGALLARYPLVLRQNAVHSLGLSLERKRLSDSVAGAGRDLDDDKRVSLAVLSLEGAAAIAAGQMRYRVALTGGDLQIKGSADYIKINQATVDTAGGFGKLWGQIEFLQPLTAWSFVNLRLSGQSASRNLDSSEKFLLGGFNGVRAYPEGEAAGDNAWLARLDWVIPISASALPGRGAVRAFVDSGGVWLVDQVRGGLASPGIENHYSLSGIGIGFNWALPQGISLTAYVATALGGNPGASAAGNNADGRSNNTRGWIGAEWTF